MTGVLGATLGSYPSVSAGPINIVVNGSATTATPVGWLGLAYYRNTTNFRTTPAAWQMNDVGNGPELTYFAINALIVGATYSISWWTRNDPLNPATTTTFAPLTFTGGTGTFSYTPTATFTYYKVEAMTANATSVYFQWYSGGNDSTIIDDIWLVAGSVAV